MEEVHDLEGMLDLVDERTGDAESVSLRELMDAVGHRSLGPWLLLAGLATLAPLIAVVVVLTLTRGRHGRRRPT